MKEKPAPKIYGLIGYPIKHSLSPAMHNAAFKELDIPAEYKLFEVRPEELEDFLLGNKDIRDAEGKTFKLNDLSGFNITIPHKVRAYEMLSSLIKNITVRQYPYVFLSGAINTVKREGGNRIEFENTDALGFIKSLEEDLRFDYRGKNVFISGCGGAGRAVIAGLTAPLVGLKSNEGLVNKIYIYDVNTQTLQSAKAHFDKFENISGRLEFIDSQEKIADALKDSQLLVNVSPIGMKEGEPSVVKKELLHKGLYVYDVVYNRQTQLIKDAHEVIGPARASGGLGMLLYQGVAAFKLWTEKTAPVEVMREALLEAVSGKSH